MHDYDLIVIGSGPGGYVAAIRGAQAGLSVALVERAELGGICLNWGCIPTKALLRSAEVFLEVKNAAGYGILTTAPLVDFLAIVSRSREVAKTNSAGVAFLLKKNKVSVLVGEAKLLAHDTQQNPCVEFINTAKECKVLCARSVILATGASPRYLPQYPINGLHFLNYRQAMALDHQPKRMLVIGSGAIGLEFSWFFNALGTQVTLLESQAQILPSEDAEVSRFLSLSLTKQGIRCLANSSLHSLQVIANEVHALVKDAKGQELEICVDQVLFAVGMTANTVNIGLENANVALDVQGFIVTDASMKTSAPNIYAIGDCTGHQMLAHKASAEAEVAIDVILGQSAAMEYTQIPACLYCHPQVASIGLCETQAKAQNIAFQVGRFPFQASGKARASGHTEGFVKLIFSPDSGIILGAQILGGDACELIATLGVALRQKLTWKDLGTMLFAHPTLSEAIAEAALASHKKAVHL